MYAEHRRFRLCSTSALALSELQIHQFREDNEGRGGEVDQQRVGWESAEGRNVPSSCEGVEYSG